MNYQEPLVEMGIRLTELAVKGTASAVQKKIKAAKSVKDADKLRTTYDELLNEVLSEREEAIVIAQAYKSELDQIVISDEDIEHLHNTVAQVMEILNGMSDQKLPVEEINQLKDLISIDALKTMQLLGHSIQKGILKNYSI